MKIGFFPGCSLEGTAKDYFESFVEVCKFVGIKLVEIDDWSCCGASSAHSMNRLLSIALPARNLALAEKHGFNEVVVPCAACYSRLSFAHKQLQTDEKIKKIIPEILETKFEGTSKPISILEFLEKYLFPKIEDKLKNNIDMKLVCYYGCLLTRPPKLTGFVNYENPEILESILNKMKAKTMDWGFKTECCGASFSISKTSIVARLSGEIIKDAVDRGADAIVVACPMCQSNLDLRRPEINEYLNHNTDIPVVYITQLIGLALGIEAKKLGLQRLFVPFKLENKIVPKIKEQK